MAEEPEAEEAGEAEETPAKVRPKEDLRTKLSRSLMIFLGLLAIYVLIFPDISKAFGDAAGAILYPVIGFGGRYPVITILLAGLLTTTLSSLVRHFYTPWARMAKMNVVTSALRKEQMEAFRKGNVSKVEKLRERQRETMAEYTDIQLLPLKQMAYTMFFFVVLFTWLRVFVDFTLVPQGNVYFAVPWSSNAHFLDVYVFPSWILLYSLLAIPYGQVVQRVLKWFSFRRKLRELGALEEPSGPGEPA